MVNSGFERNTDGTAPEALGTVSSDIPELDGGRVSLGLLPLSKGDYNFSFWFGGLDLQSGVTTVPFTYNTRLREIEPYLF